MSAGTTRRRDDGGVSDGGKGDEATATAARGKGRRRRRQDGDCRQG
ncbi:hypothetical protein FHU41_001497 [Psychromicrobium silvestre]|uniref:Uncharacterized protein n=1 Tax=Psychromicrobium silvestre TaxID=1645614 RepID=A0A7Y9LTE8_9MICC|nr:hypothetical protein [Psychromicrobium silvestre]NYE95276.1 hypothetical protein [Psychromicrobium silvestre]